MGFGLRGDVFIYVYIGISGVCVCARAAARRSRTQTNADINLHSRRHGTKLVIWKLIVNNHDFSAISAIVRYMYIHQ